MIPEKLENVSGNVAVVTLPLTLENLEVVVQCNMKWLPFIEMGSHQVEVIDYEIDKEKIKAVVKKTTA